MDSLRHQSVLKGHFGHNKGRHLKANLKVVVQECGRHHFSPLHRSSNVLGEHHSKEEVIACRLAAFKVP